MPISLFGKCDGGWATSVSRVTDVGQQYLMKRRSIANATRELAGFGWTTFPWYAKQKMHCILHFALPCSWG